MRCYICDKTIDEPTWDADWGAFDPCDGCMAVVHEILAGYKDRPYLDEDELGDDKEMAALYQAWGFTYEPPE